MGSSLPLGTVSVVDHIRAILKKRLGENVYQLRISPLEFSWTANELVIVAPNPLLLEDLQTRQLSLIRGILKELGEASAPVHCLLGSRNMPLPPVDFPRTPTKDPIPVDNRESPLDLNDRLTFEEFVVGPDNQMAYASCRAVAQGPGGQFNPLFLYGKTGLGKTHLLQGIYHSVRKEFPQFRVVYTNCETFTNGFIDSIKRHSLEKFRAVYRQVDVLIVDDIQFLANKESTQEEFFHTFSELIAAGRQVIVSSDAPPSELRRFEDRLTSRFSSGLVTSIDRPLYETRLAVLRQRASRLDCKISAETLQEIAAFPIDSIRELNGALTTLAAHAVFSGLAVDHSLIETLFPRWTRSPSRRLDWDDVVSLVTEHFNVRLQDLQSKRRQKTLVAPRHMAMYLLRRFTNHSLEEIGAFFGGRDHSTVQHAQMKIESQRLVDPEISRMIKGFEETLKGG